MTTRDDQPLIWRCALAGAGLTPEGVFGAEFLAVYGARDWSPGEGDLRAARLFHIELISRIATQSLGYSEGVEERALSSIFELFPTARAITAANLNSATFEVLCWHVLNSRVRHFTAKWHSKSAAGALRALDSSDEFRRELANVQSALIELDRALQLVGGNTGYVVDRTGQLDRDFVGREMAGSVRWRPMGVEIPDAAGLPDQARSHPLAVAPTGDSLSDNPLPSSEIAAFASKERDAVRARRTLYHLDPQRSWAAGLALSGGGIRSATFSMGVMVSLAKRNLLPQFDYLSTVSGGGYSGSFLTQLLGRNGDKPGLSLCGSDLPFARCEGEGELLRRIRQNASYLSGTFWERFAVIMAQAHGVFMNLLVLALATAMLSYADYAIRLLVPERAAKTAAFLSVVLVAATFVAIPFVQKAKLAPKRTDRWMAALGCVFILPILWTSLGGLHRVWRTDLALEGPTVWLTALSSTLAIAGAVLAAFSKLRPFLLSVLIILLLIVLEGLTFNWYHALGPLLSGIIFAVSGSLWFYLWLALDVNMTSLHGYYRAKLAAAFLIDPTSGPSTPILMSEFDPRTALFPIINCAVNVPGSKNSSMRGRHCDIFSITPVAVGAGILGYKATRDWELANPKLDLATAMAISGAAVSPQMGLRTTRYASFWLTALNLRLGLWLRKPGDEFLKAWGPGVRHLLRELSATADECGSFVNVSDGGHIENLGAYELLRRRCRFIVVVDGESDPTMTFHALTNLQRLAYIDFGVVLEADLDDLRFGSSGYSRSHFRFCRILYPRGRQDTGVDIGYLVYLKLSLTGNEGEFIRRYKFDEPAFPHQSTADQFFSEQQFEAYRALGEHVGEKLFLPAIVGDLGENVDLEHWIEELGLSFLDARPAATQSQPARAP